MKQPSIPIVRKALLAMRGAKAALLRLGPVHTWPETLEPEQLRALLSEARLAAAELHAFLDHQTPPMPDLSRIKSEPIREALEGLEAVGMLGELHRQQARMALPNAFRVWGGLCEQLDEAILVGTGWLELQRSDMEAAASKAAADQGLPESGA